jgi:hypothetical protein
MDHQVLRAVSRSLSVSGVLTTMASLRLVTSKGHMSEGSNPVGSYRTDAGRGSQTLRQSGGIRQLRSRPPMIATMGCTYVTLTAGIKHQSNTTTPQKTRTDRKLFIAALCIACVFKSMGCWSTVSQPLLGPVTRRFLPSHCLGLDSTQRVGRPLPE